MKEWAVRDNVKVRLVAPEDAGSLYDQIEKTRPLLAKFMPWGDAMQSVDEERDFLLYCQGRMADKKLWITSVLVDDKPVGMIDLHNINLDNKNAEVGYWLGGEYQGNGVMTDCLLRVLEVGFEEMHLHKIKLLAEVVNEASNAVALKAGFKLEGQLKDEIYSDGEFHDANLYGLTK